eukprot:14953317-Heterocapsa_arctica.AAC.1
MGGDGGLRSLDPASPPSSPASRDGLPSRSIYTEEPSAGCASQKPPGIPSENWLKLPLEGIPHATCSSERPRTSTQPS